MRHPRQQWLTPELSAEFEKATWHARDASSGAAICRKHGVPAHVYTNWRRRTGLVESNGASSDAARPEAMIRHILATQLTHILEAQKARWGFA